MKFAYADPPYLGCGKRHYGEHHAEAAEWDKPETHQMLINRLNKEFPHGWALSASAPSLPVILPMCPAEARIGIYCKRFAQIRPTRVQWFWEPVIWTSVRKKPDGQHYRDWCLAWPRNAAQDGLIGGKPRDFCFWVFDLLGATANDELVDLFPGTGAVMNAWLAFTKNQAAMPALPLEEAMNDPRA